MKSLLTFAILFSLHVQAAQTTLTGNHDEMDYLIVFSDEWEDVGGSWGDVLKYKLAFDSYDLKLRGKTAGTPVDFYYDSLNKQVLMESDCGFTNLNFDFKNYNAAGTFCDASWNQSFASKSELIEIVSELFLKDLVRFFPAPTKKPVHDFFKPKFIRAFNLENAN